MCQAYCAAILPGRINVTRHVIPAPESGFARKGVESRIPPRPRVESYAQLSLS